VETAADPFDSLKAAHLLNRAAFGGAPAEIDQILRLGPAKAVDLLLSFPDASAQEQNPRDLPDLSLVAAEPDDQRVVFRTAQGLSEQERRALLAKYAMANGRTMVHTGQWWLKRMIECAYPLQEKLTLFWHGHFTTSARDERSAKLMWDQNELLRKMAAGNFGKLVHAISKNPAMLDYLNNTQNRKQHPNENYARELMELFTLGIGNYSEDDVKQAARAFTGWTHDGEKFIFQRKFHDDDEKTFFGQHGNFDGDDIVEMILKKPACATYIAGRFWKFFVQEEPDQAVAIALGNILRSNQYELRPMLRAMLTSRAFYSPEVIGAQVKSPVQLATGIVRLLGMTIPADDAAPMNALRIWQSFRQMGQVLFEPPNVKGWPGGRAWINTSTLYVRYNTAVQLVGGLRGALKEPRGLFDPQGSPSQIVDAWVTRLLSRPIDPHDRQTLLDALGNKPDAQAVRQLVCLIVSMPDFQLC
jgi:uncharacterized protein (DUF1800 family)